MSEGLDTLDGVSSPRSRRKDSLPWPSVPRTDPMAAWAARMESEIEHLGAVQERILDRLERPTTAAVILRAAVGPKGENVRWLVLGSVALAIVVLGVSASVQTDAFRIATDKAVEDDRPARLLPAPSATDPAPAP